MLANNKTKFIQQSRKGPNRDVNERYATRKSVIRKIRYSGPRGSGVWNLGVVKFPVKHSLSIIKK